MSGHPYIAFARSFADRMRSGRGLPLGGFPPLRPPAGRGRGAPLALLLSPHPDDECITGALPLRLLRSAGWRVLNVAVTLGSRRDRQAARWRELRAACGFLGFETVRTAPRGLERIHARGRAADPGNWEAAVRTLAGIVRRHRPRVLFAPHPRDWNATHIGVSRLAREALRRPGTGFDGWLVETEYWGAMDRPNLMVESSPEELGHLAAALSFHVGEVERNPYHLSLPAWMMDTVRRGGELVGGQGTSPPDYPFATLYRALRCRGGRLRPAWTNGRFLPRGEDPGALFEPPTGDR